MECHYPSQNECKVGHLTFTSRFDSGNLKSVKRADNDGAYEIETSPDCAETAYETDYTSWFHFAIKGCKKGERITLRISKLNKHPSLYDNGMRPVCRIVPSQPKWFRVKRMPKHEIIDNKSYLTFDHQCDRDDSVAFFAFCYPYAYKDLQTKLQGLDRRLMNKADNQLYYHRELLTKSLDGHRIDLVTISSRDGITEEAEINLTNLFPEREPRARRFQNKRVVFISARVHPGETPASHVLDGIFEFLLRTDDERARILRREYVFKIIPMLNPDGVVRGHYRVDTNGSNLNRHYQNPCPDQHPSIFAAKQIVLHHHMKENLTLYLDLHAHATKRGCFLYGNHFDNQAQQISSQLYARLVGINSSHFEYDQCNFSENNMKQKDKRDSGLSKEGSGRVALYRETRLTHIYTLECNYNMARRPTYLPAATGDNQGRASPAINRRSFACTYSPQSWQDVGNGLLLALLDLFRANPWSRVPKSPWRSHHGLRQSITEALLVEEKKKHMQRKTTMARRNVLPPYTVANLTLQK